MKHMKSKFIPIISIIVMLSMLCGCSAGNMKGADNNAYFPESAGWIADDDIVYEQEAPAEPEPDIAVTMPSASADTMPGSPESDAVAQSERKIIKNKTLRAETLEFDKFVSELTARVSEFGGYIQNSTQKGRTTYGRSSLRSASFTIRIPSQQFEQFTDEVGTLATVTYTNEYIDDITAKYVDVEARLAALRAEQESFLKLMDKAQTIEEILQIQSYLTDVNYQIESYTAQLNSYKSLVTYSTLNLEINEVEKITPPEEKGVFARIRTNIDSNLYNIGEGFKDMFVGVISSAPYLGIFAVIVIIIVIVVKLIIAAFRKSAKKMPQNPPESKPQI